MKVIVLKDEDDKVLISDEKTDRLYKLERYEGGVYISNVNEDDI
jgi:hypothetical protein